MQCALRAQKAIFEPSRGYLGPYGPSGPYGPYVSIVGGVVEDSVNITKRRRRMTIMMRRIVMILIMGPISWPKPMGCSCAFVFVCLCACVLVCSWDRNMLKNAELNFSNVEFADFS